MHAPTLLARTVCRPDQHETFGSDRGIPWQSPIAVLVCLLFPTGRASSAWSGHLINHTIAIYRFYIQFYRNSTRSVCRVCVLELLLVVCVCAAFFWLNHSRFTLHINLLLGRLRRRHCAPVSRRRPAHGTYQLRYESLAIT